MDETFQKEMLDNQVRVALANVFWTHKTHAKCHDILKKRNNNLSKIIIILSGIVTSGIMLNLFGNCRAVTILNGIFTTILTILTAYQKGKNYGDLIHEHKQAADVLWNIREEYVSLLYDINGGLAPISRIIEKRDILQTRVNEIYKIAPPTNAEGYMAATNSIKSGDSTFTKEELNLVVPPDLRK